MSISYLANLKNVTVHNFFNYIILNQWYFYHITKRLFKIFSYGFRFCAWYSYPVFLKQDSALYKKHLWLHFNVYMQLYCLSTPKCYKNSQHQCLWYDNISLLSEATLLNPKRTRKENKQFFTKIYRKDVFIKWIFNRYFRYFLFEQTTPKITFLAKIYMF